MLKFVITEKNNLNLACFYFFLLTFATVREQAILLIEIQTLKGAITLLHANNSHPEAEIDRVTTPGGITIKGLNAMEQAGFTNAVIQGLKASVLDQQKVPQAKTNAVEPFSQSFGMWADREIDIKQIRQKSYER